MTTELDPKLIDLMAGLAKYHADNYLPKTPAYAPEIRGSRFQGRTELTNRIIGNLFRLLKCFAAYNIDPEGKPNDAVEIRRVWDGENSPQCKGCMLMGKCSIHNPQLTLPNRPKTQEVIKLTTENPTFQVPVPEDPKQSQRTASRRWTKQDSELEVTPKTRIIGEKTADQKRQLTDQEVIENFERSIVGNSDENLWKKLKEEDPIAYITAIKFNGRYDPQDDDEKTTQRLAKRQQRKLARKNILDDIGDGDWVSDMEKETIAEEERIRSRISTEDEFEHEEIKQGNQTRTKDKSTTEQISVDVKTDSLSAARRKGFTDTQITQLEKLFDKNQSVWTSEDWRLFEDFFNITVKTNDETATKQRRASKSERKTDSKAGKIRKYFDKFDPNHTPGYTNKKGEFIPTTEYAIIDLISLCQSGQLSKDILKTLIPNQKELDIIKQAIANDDASILNALLEKTTALQRQIITAYMNDDSETLSIYNISLEQAKTVYTHASKTIIKVPVRTKAIDFASRANRDTNTGNVKATSFNTPEALHQLKISVDTLQSRTNYEAVAYIGNVPVTPVEDIMPFDVIDPNSMSCYAATVRNNYTKEGIPKKGWHVSSFPFAHYGEKGQLFDLLIDCFEGDGDSRIQAREYLMQFNPSNDEFYNPSICKDCTIEECALVGIYHLMKARMYRIGGYFRACKRLEIFIQEYDFDSLWNEQPIIADKEQTTAEPHTEPIVQPVIPGVIPELFNIAPEQEYTAEQPFEIELVEDYRFEIEYDTNGKIVKVRYPDAGHCKAANWPDPIYLEYDIYKTQFQEVVDRDAIDRLKTLNQTVKELKAFRIESNDDLAQVKMKYQQLRDLSIPNLKLGHTEFINELQREIWAYFQLKSIEYRYRNFIQDGRTFTEKQSDPKLMELTGELLSIYDNVASLTKDEMLSVLGFRNVVAVTFRKYIKEKYGVASKQVQEVRAASFKYKPSDILVAYEVYMRPGNKYEDTAKDLGLNSDIFARIDRQFQQNGLPSKRQQLITEELAKQVRNLWLMTGLPINELTPIFIGSGLNYINNITTEYGLEVMDEGEIAKLRIKPKIGIQLALSISAYLISENRKLQEKLRRQNPESPRVKWITHKNLMEAFNLSEEIEQKAIGRAFKRLGLWRLDDKGQEVCEQGNDAIQFHVQGIQYKIVASGNEYAIINCNNFTYHPISRTAYKAFKCSHEWKKSGNVGNMREKDPIKLYKETIPYPPNPIDYKLMKVFLGATLTEIANALNNMQQVQIGFTNEP